MTEYRYPAAQAAAEVLQRLAPQAAEPVLPLLDELFAAQEGGHSYIMLAPQEAEALRRAAPVVGDALPISARSRLWCCAGGGCSAAGCLRWSAAWPPNCSGLPTIG